MIPLTDLEAALRTILHFEQHDLHGTFERLRTLDWEGADTRDLPELTPLNLIPGSALAQLGEQMAGKLKSAQRFGEPGPAAGELLRQWRQLTPDPGWADETSDTYGAVMRAGLRTGWHAGPARQLSQNTDLPEEAWPCGLWISASIGAALPEPHPGSVIIACALRSAQATFLESRADQWALFLPWQAPGSAQLELLCPAAVSPTLFWEAYAQAQSGPQAPPVLTSGVRPAWSWEVGNQHVTGERLRALLRVIQGEHTTEQAFYPQEQP